jgi:hypothetical protein
MEDYDSMIAIENLLISGISKNSCVDGHDVGSDEVNIFIETDDPQRLYDEVRSLLGSHDAWSAFGSPIEPSREAHTRRSGQALA